MPTKLNRNLQELHDLRLANKAANMLIGQAADEAKRLQDIIDIRDAEICKLKEEKCNLQNQVDNFDVNWQQQQLIIDELRRQTK